MKEPILLNIASVEIIEASQLASAQRLSGWRIFIGSILFWRKLDIFGFAQLSIADKKNCQQRVFTTELQFMTDSIITNEGSNFAFKLTTVSGGQYIMGLSYPPFTRIVNAVSMPKDPKNKSGNTVTVTLEGPFPPLLFVG